MKTVRDYGSEAPKFTPAPRSEVAKFTQVYPTPNVNCQVGLMYGELVCLVSNYLTDVTRININLKKTESGKRIYVSFYNVYRINDR